MKRTYYIRCIGDKWHRPFRYKYNADTGIDFGKIIIGRSKADLHELIKNQLDDLDKYDIIKIEQKGLKKNIELLENRTKKLDTQIEILKDQIDDLEAEKSDLQDEVYELEETIDECDYKTLYKENRTYE